MSRKLTIEEMQKIAKRHGGKCVSKKYVNSKAKLVWECASGHRWKATPNSVKHRTWCFECSVATKRLAIEEMQKIAKRHGGKCVSKKYVNSKAKLVWECAKGHRWDAVPHQIKAGSWCPACVGVKKLTIDKMREIAKSHGGKCLSKKYVNGATKLKWECASGHRWMATPRMVRTNKFRCKECRDKQLFKELQGIAKRHGGKCLSKKYVNGVTKLKWECASGHRWMARPDKIKNGRRWCPQCGGSEKLTIKLMRELAKSRSGKCLSKKYVNANTKLEWECSKGHRWWTTPSSIKNNMTWCPECTSRISERICKAYFEQIFDKPFPKSHPRWLNGLELDGYCKSLKIAFEHQGEHHYSRLGFFQSTKRQHESQKKRDQDKASLCKKHGIRLFVIPQLHTRTKLDDLIQLIFQECKRLRVRRPKGMLSKKIKLIKTWALDWQIQELKKMKAFAKSKGGECVSTVLISRNVNLEWECANGHRWKASPHNVTKERGTWCPDCAGTKRLDLKDMQKLARENNGKCLSKKYVNASTKLEWECDRGHTWLRTPNEVQQCKWCFQCDNIDKKLLEFKKLQEIAKSHGGKCLSNEYVHSNIKLEWQCVNGHKFTATPGSAKSQVWCPTCAGNKILTIDDMQKFAKLHRGKCLSKKYVNGVTKLKWECASGHNWMATINVVRKNKFRCKDCYDNKLFKELHKIAKRHGGQCLSKKYVNAHVKLEWECSEGHRWKAVPSSIKHGGSWCSDCAGTKKLTIEEMRRIAKRHGGKCLSKKYLNGATKLKWECANGHRWMAASDNIRNRNHWCPQCSGNKKLTIRDMQTIAKRHGGKCLSKKYVNAQTKLKWECSKGHRWKTTPGSVRGGTWCKKCYHESRKKLSD